MNKPFYDLIRPKKLEDVIGQKHIIGEGKLIRKLYDNRKITSLIFYGPPGTGKTTIANILIERTNIKYYKLNATYSNTKDIRDIIEAQKGFLEDETFVIMIDEIHNFNKKQQQLLLEYIENGRVILIANTTENPYFHIYKSLLSRVQVIEFKALSNDDMHIGIKNIISNYENIICDDDAIKSMISLSNGDYRKVISTLGLIIELEGNDKKIHITKETIKNISASKVLDYDKNSESHYNILSAFQKSIRGSDADAAIHYLARLCEAEDIDSIARRLLVIACEDVGLAYPNAITIVKSCVDSAYMVGFPEARIIFAQATILLSILPKSNSSYIAINDAISDLRNLNITEIPKNILNSISEDEMNTLKKGLGYLYPHDFENYYVEQDYMPKIIKDKKYYIPKNNKFEKSAEEYFKKIKKFK